MLAIQLFYSGAVGDSGTLTYSTVAHPALTDGTGNYIFLVSGPYRAADGLELNQSCICDAELYSYYHECGRVPSIRPAADPGRLAIGAIRRGSIRLRVPSSLLRRGQSPSMLGVALLSPLPSSGRIYPMVASRMTLEVSLDSRFSSRSTNIV